MIIRTVDRRYAPGPSKDGHAPAMMNAGIVKTAPAATDSPIEPAVRAMFSWRIVPLRRRSHAMLMTAAGYVAAIVCPALRPRYALAAPSTTVITRPRTSVPIVNSLISTFCGTNGLCSSAMFFLLLRKDPVYAVGAAGA